jgi:uncharacterized protein YbjQ (UPF0145 family)
MDFFTFICLLTVGYISGRIAEKRHYRSIRSREAALRGLPAVSAKFPPLVSRPMDETLVSGNVVISVDYFKRITASLRNLVGGRVKSYETLLDRARREAVLRMKAEASRHGAIMVLNTKFETASISKGRRNAIGSVEVLAYGTALIPAKAGA